MTSRLPSRAANERVPAWLPRVTAGVTAVLLLAHLLGAPAWLLAVLLPDFLARSLDRREWAWLGRVSRVVAPRVLSARALRPSSAWPPKRFASRMGLAMLVVILGAPWVGAPALTLPLGLAMAGLCILEAAFGFCVACRMYTVFGRLGWVTACPDGQCTLPQ